MRRVFIAVAILVALAGCGADDTPEPSGGGRSDDTRGEDPALQPMPRDAEELCVSMALVRAACPRLVPKAPAFSAREIERPGLGYTTFSLEAGLSYADPSRDRPPSFVHLVVEGGKVRPSLDVLVYSHRRPVRSRDGLLDGPESREAVAKNPPNALFLGDRTWGGKRGELVLAPPYDKVVSIRGPSHFRLERRKDQLCPLASRLGALYRVGEHSGGDRGVDPLTCARLVLVE